MVLHWNERIASYPDESEIRRTVSSVTSTVSWSQQVASRQHDRYISRNVYGRHAFTAEAPINDILHSSLFLYTVLEFRQLDVTGNCCRLLWQAFSPVVTAKVSGKISESNGTAARW